MPGIVKNIRPGLDRRMSNLRKRINLFVFLTVINKFDWFQAVEGLTWKAVLDI